MKSTSEDRKFATAFGEALRSHYAKRDGSDEAFASTLDVSRAALKKYLSGSAMPTLRVIVLAHARYGINVPYLGTPLFGKARGALRRSRFAQLILPFSVEAIDAGAFETRIEAKGDNRFEVRVHLEKVV